MATMKRPKSPRSCRLPLPELPAIAVDDLLIEGRFGPLRPGVKRQEVLRALGPPDTHSYRMPVERATIWVYGKVCRGHLELHFLEGDELWMIFSDYLPIRRHRTAAFRIEPGCLGGLVTPPVGEVVAALARRGVHATVSPRDPRWSDAPPPKDMRRIAVRDWNRTCRAIEHASVESSFHAEVRLPSGVILGVGTEVATLPSGERVAREDAVIVMSAPMSP